MIKPATSHFRPQMDLKLEQLSRENKKLEKECSEFLEKSPNVFFQQTLEWRDLIENIKTDKSVFLIAKNKNKIVGILPLFIIESPYGNVINSVPYPGPLGGIAINSKDNKEKIFRFLVDSLEELAKKEECILATIISSPFENDANLYRKYLKPDWELENYTLYIDLKRPVITKSHFRNNLKRMLKKASDKGMFVKETSDRNLINRWYKVHTKRHTELNLEPIPRQIIFGAIKYLIPKNKAKFFVVMRKNAIEAGCLVCYHKNIVDTYIYSGSQNSYKNGAMYLLVDHILTWARNKSFSIMNWQSSKPRGGGPYNFKMQWGSKESPYFFFTKKYGSIDKLKKLGLEGVKINYRWHFVLPYSIFENSQALDKQV